VIQNVDCRMPTHTYRLTNRWTGNQGSGTSGYKAYGRDHEISISGKPVLPGSSDPHYRGDPTRYNPEEFLLAAISGCHMLWYLHFCSESQIIVVNYVDEAEATMEVAADGNGRFTKAVLRPRITVTSDDKAQLAEHLHEKAHKFCFIANSVNFPITVEPHFEIAHT
jgi:organic hydroperoxide reductase OsmC/OhrA